MKSAPAVPIKTSAPAVPVSAVIAAEGTPVLPARSVAVAVREWRPAGRTVGNDQVPDAAAITVPTFVAPSNSVIRALPSAVPETAAVVASLITGDEGAVVSRVVESVVENTLMLPARSVARAAMAYLPSASVVDVMSQLPEAPTFALPIAEPLAKSVTVEPASPVPLKLGVVTDVMLSVLDVPLSDATTRSSAVGRPGAVESIVTDRGAERTLPSPPRLVACAVI